MAKSGGIRPYKATRKTGPGTTAAPAGSGFKTSQLKQRQTAKQFDNPPLGNSNNGLTMQRQFDPNAPAGRGGKAQAYNNAKAFESRTGGAPKGGSNPKVSNYIAQRGRAGEFGNGVGMPPREKAPHDNMYSEVPKVSGEPGKTGALAGGGTPKYNTPHLQFPSDVGAEPGMGNQGHYILFMINETKDPQIMASEQGTDTLQDHLMGGDYVVKLLDDAKKTNPSLTKKQLETWKNVLTTAGKIRDARQQKLKDIGIASTAVVTKADIEAAGGKKIFSEFTQSYKTVPIWDEIDQQYLIGSSAELERYLSEASDRSATSSAFNKGLKSTISVKARETTRLAGGISLYMPPTISTTSTAQYTDSEIGVGAALAGAFIDEFKSSGASGIGNNITARLNSLGPEAKEGLQNLALKSIGVVPGMQGADVVRDIQRGFIKAPRMELAFKGIGKRSFSYEFKMIPKSRDEADTVRDIVKTFRANMLPEFLKGTDRSARFFKMPNTFDISYMYNGGQNQYLHEISTCVCKSVAVTYGGDRYKTFDANETGAPPVETSISLQFEELEIITKERVMEGM
jgi:hypothetical protein